MEPMNVVLPLVVHVTTNVSLVKMLPTIVLNVKESELQPHSVTVHINSTKKPTENAFSVWTNVTDVTVMPVIVMNVEVPELTLQIVTVHLDIIED
jgi:hypothetical protein